MIVFPALTADFAAVLALIYVGLSAWVIAGRTAKNTLQGDGGDDDLEKRIRAHGNFGEYVPFALLLIGFLEASGGSVRLVEGLLVVLLVARVLHPIGLFAPVNSPRQFACRGGGILGTLAVLVVAAIALLAHLS